jgi:hypothetical protein
MRRCHRPRLRRVLPLLLRQRRRRRRFPQRTQGSGAAHPTFENRLWVCLSYHTVKDDSDPPAFTALLVLQPVEFFSYVSSMVMLQLRMVDLCFNRQASGPRTRAVPPPPPSTAPTSIPVWCTNRHLSTGVAPPFHRRHRMCEFQSFPAPSPLISNRPPNYNPFPLIFCRSYAAAPTRK